MPEWRCAWCARMTDGDQQKPDQCHACETKIGHKSPAEGLAPTPVRYAPKPAETRQWAKRSKAVVPESEVNESLAKTLLQDIREEASKRGAPEKIRMRYTPPDERHLLEIAPVDLHVGKLAWGEETGADYDIRIAEKVFVEAIDEILYRASVYPIERIVFPVGNDLLQTDNLQGTTTAGTYVDTDSRYIKSFRRARKITSWAIRRMAEVCPVEVPIVPGNHDQLTAFHLGEVLEAEFASDPRVQIDNSPKLRKYVQYGISLVGFTHGNDIKLPDLPTIMATEVPDLWAKSLHREWHIGHFHKAKETRYTAGDSFNGVRVRVLPSLCAPDAWHFARGYVGERRACEAYLWSHSTGYAGHFSANVLPLSA